MRWIAIFGIVLSCLSAVGAQEAEEQEIERPPEEIIAELPGLIIPRTVGGWVQIQMEGVRLTLTFYNEKAKHIAPDVDRAVVRFKPTTGKLRTRVLIPLDSNPMALSHGDPVRQPHVFMLFINFFIGESSEAVESYQVHYPQE